MPEEGAGRQVAVVFDCDGTLVDTERISDLTFRELMPRYGRSVTDDDLAAIRGRPWSATWDRFRAVVPVDEVTFRRAYRDVFVRLFEEQGRLFDDAVATVRALHARRVPLAVCSSSSRRHVERVLDLGLSDCFAATVAAEDTDEHKPAPAPYLEAARRLGVAPSRCAAAEDSPVGVAAASAAGMWTVGVARPGRPRAALAGADVVVAGLSAELFDRAHAKGPGEGGDRGPSAVP